MRSPPTTTRTRPVRTHSRPRAEAGRGWSALVIVASVLPRPRSLSAPGDGKTRGPRLHVSKHTSPRAGAHDPSGLHQDILLAGLPRTPFWRSSHSGHSRKFSYSVLRVRRSWA